MGWLWCNWGRWGSTQVVPEGWLRKSVRVNGDLLENAPREQWQYGYGFWSNEYGLLWPNLPRDGFTASGAGGHYVTVFPSQRLVIVQNPGPYRAGPDASRANGDLLAIVLDAIK